MTTIVTRQGKGSPLTWADVDANFTNLNTDKLESNISSNITFTGTGQRILGDFSSSTITNRTMFQTSITNGNTRVQIIPNGSSVTSDIRVGNSSDPTNASVAILQANTTSIGLSSDINGTGSYLPMTFSTGGSEKVRLDTLGNVGIGRTPTSKLDIYDASSTVAFTSQSGAVVAQSYSSSGGGLAAIGTSSAHPLIIQVGGATKYQFGTAGQLGIGGATYGTAGQVLTSGGPSAAPSWSSAVVFNSTVRVHTSNGYGSTNTVIRRFTTTVLNQGSDITYADSATAGASFTINSTGMYAVSYVDNLVSASNIGISVDSAQLTSTITTITAANRLGVVTQGVGNQSQEVSTTVYLTAGQVIRPHSDGIATGTGAAMAQFTITRVA